MTNHTNRAPARVLVTGASGAIGTATTAELVRHGIAVTALSLAGPFPPGADRRIAGDATSPDDVAEGLDGVEAVVHLAAIPHPSLGTPYEVYRTNVTATFNVLSSAGALGIRRAVIASSINAFGVPMNAHKPMPAYFPLDEELPVDLEDAYSLSKNSDESTARMAWRRWGIDVVAIRFPLVKDIDVLREAAVGARADPSQTVREGWSYLDTRDAARAIRLALSAPLSGSHVIAVSANDTLVDRPTAQMLAEFAPGVPLRAPIEGFDTAIDTRRARELLGFEPEHSLSDPPVSVVAPGSAVAPEAVGALGLAGSPGEPSDDEPVSSVGARNV
jgi:nucleoside-diphosphate-sugar epimerase